MPNSKPDRFDIGDYVDYKGRFCSVKLVLNPSVDNADYLIEISSKVYTPVLHTEIKPYR